MSTPPVNGALHEPTDEQWEAIRRCDEHLLVAASAGTGKTFTVVRKLLYLMGVETRGQRIVNPMRLRDLAAITYTSKAAAELKARLRADLRAVGRRADAYEVDAARVGTIHSFCGDVLREFALRSGRSPALTLLDDAEGRRLAAECVREAVLTCVEDASVAGLDELLAERSVADVERWVRELLGHGDHLRVLGGNSAGFGDAERVLMELAGCARDVLEARLVADGAMDFDRMIIWTRDLLRDDPIVRKALQRRIRVLVVDEFQDVDPVQKEIAWLLGDPDSHRTDTTRLVLVGDPKQSIYRFRKADVTVWRGVEEGFARSRNGVVVPLSRSRRSVPAVLGFVDHVVGALLDAPLDGEALRAFEVPHAGVSSTRESAPPHAGVELLCVAPKEDGKCHTAEVVRRSEAAAVARRARQLHEQGVAWGEIAVLLSGWGALDLYADALRREGIPVYALRGTGYWDRREVLDVLVALEALRNPAERRWLFGFLRGPMVGLRDESLLALVHARQDIWFRRHELSLADPAQQARWRRGVELLERWATLRDRVSVAELVELILADTGYCAHLQLRGGDEARQRIGNVRKLVRIAGASPDLTVGDFLAVVEEQRALDVREGDARLHGEGDDVVTITSVHSAKGLEWSVVFWCDLVRVGKDDDSKLLVGRERVLLGADVKRDEQEPEWLAQFERIREEREAETKRLWYVAATRAKDLLVLGGIALGEGGRDTGSMSRELKARFPALIEGGRAPFQSSAGETFQALVAITPAVEEDAGAAMVPAPLDAGVLATAQTPLVVPSGGQRSSATQLMAFERCGQRHWLKYIVGLKEPRPVLPASERTGGDGDLTPIERGLVVHDVLERWESEGALEAMVEDALARWAPDAPEPDGRRGRRLREDIAAEVAGALERPELRAVLEHPQARRELGFTLVDPAGSAIEGAVDLIAPSANGYDIVDVKTSDCDAAEAVLKAGDYDLQRAAYLSAVSRISGGDVGSFGFEFTRAGTSVGGTLDASALEGARARIAATIGEIAAGAPRKGAAAECRFCGYRSAGWCAGVAALEDKPTGAGAAVTAG